MRVCVKCHRSCRMNTTPDSDRQIDETAPVGLRESRKRFASQENLDEQSHLAEVKVHENSERASPNINDIPILVSSENHIQESEIHKMNQTTQTLRKSSLENKEEESDEMRKKR